MSYPVVFRRPALDCADLAPGMAFGGGAIRQISLDPGDPDYAFIAIEVDEDRIEIKLIGKSVEFRMTSWGILRVGSWRWRLWRLFAA